MKANLKGFGGIKGLILLHGEKILIFAVGFCTLLFIYYSMQLERLDDRYQAERLKQEINQTEAVVRDSSWEKALAENPDEVRVAKKLDKNAAPEIDPEDYPFPGVDPVVIKPTILRDDPPLLAAKDLEGTGVSGLLPFLDEKVMKERALKRAAEEAQKAKEEQQRMEREQQQADQGGEGGRRGRRGGRDEESRGYEYDPEHPNRRPLEGMAQAPGAQVMGDERIERSFFAIVVAKVPIKEQLKLYRDAFENTRGGYNPQYDFPNYAGYLVQRAEVQPGKELQWVNVDVEDGQGNKMGDPGRPAPVNRNTMTKLFEVIQKDWAAQMPDPVDPRWLDPSGLLAFPLPPLLGRDWGREATHPDIPLAINAPPPEMEPDPTLNPQDRAPTTDEQGFSQNLDPSMGNFGRAGGEGGRLGMSYGRGSALLGDEGGGRGRGGYGRSMVGRRGYGDREGGGFSRGGLGATAGTLPRGVESYLLRFIDFSAEPGKKYKYRVRLVVFDPNNYYVNNPDLQPNTLASSVLNRLRESAKKSSNKIPPYYRLADWSEPSPTVGIPLAGNARLASIKAPSAKLYNDEPSATLLVESFDLDEEHNAIQAANEKELKRGYVANMVEDTEYIISDGRSIDKKDNFRFLTGITVVDMAGGEKLKGDMTTPGRVLLLDPSGELYIRHELDDSEAVRLHKIIFAKPKRNRDGETPMRGREGGYRGGRGLNGY